MNKWRAMFTNLPNNIFLHFALLDEKSGYTLARIAAVALMEIRTHFF